MDSLGEFEYSKKDLIGHGAFAVVFKGRYRKNPDQPVAIKCVTKKNLAKSQTLLSKEIKILKELSGLHHGNVVALLDCKETAQHVYLVMEYCNGGDLADFLQVKGTLSEDTISTFLRQIAGAMKALNAKGVVHRDLKPQNILLQCPDNRPNPPTSDIILKIADFGFARFLHDGVMAATLCGSPMYMAPEVIMSLQYDAKADLWSIGTIVFQCLTGKAPFQAQTPQQLKSYYEKHNDLIPNIPNGTSADLKDLLLKMLKRNAASRIDFDEFFKHPFLVDSHSSSSPVPVPSRKRLNSDSPPLKEVRASPLSRHLAVSPHSDKARSPPVDGDFVKVDTDHTPKSCSPITPKTGSPNEDFVMVPDHFADDTSESVIMAKTLESTGMVLDSSGSQSSKPPSTKALKVDQSTGCATYKKQSSSPKSDDTSPNRPVSLGLTQPIPVPSQVKAYEKMQRNSPNSPSKSKKDMGTSVSNIVGSSDEAAKKTETHLVDVGSMSPLNVNFVIGTPEYYMGRTRSMSNPAAPSSPQRKGSGATPPRHNSATPPYSGPPSLPRFGAYGINTTTRHNTVPDNMMAYASDGNSCQCHGSDGRTYTEPDSLGNVTKFNENVLLKAAFGSPAHKGCSSKSPPYGIMVPYSSSSSPHHRERRMSSHDSFERSNSFSHTRHDSLSRTRGSSFCDSSPSSLPYAQSPPNMEGPIMFMAPALSEETLMEKDHNETVKKLQFVQEVVTQIIELAKLRSSPISESMLLEKTEKQSGGLIFASESQRLIDQLVLYVRALHFLSSSLQLAKNEVKKCRLQPSNNVKGLLKTMNESYHQCLDTCKQLKSATQIKTVCTQKASATADKLIYNFAIEMCQTAALEEMFGNPKECFRRYHSAQILLHALSQQTKYSQDRDLLERYKEAVERRLFNLEDQGFIISSHSG